MIQILFSILLCLSSNSCNDTIDNVIKIEIFSMDMDILTIAQITCEMFDRQETTQTIITNCSTIHKIMTELNNLEKYTNEYYKPDTRIKLIIYFSDGNTKQYCISPSIVYDYENDASYKFSDKLMNILKKILPTIVDLDEVYNKRIEEWKKQNNKIQKKLSSKIIKI